MPMPALCKGCPEAEDSIIPLWIGTKIVYGCDGECIEECMQEARE